LHPVAINFLPFCERSLCESIIGFFTPIWYIAHDGIPIIDENVLQFSFGKHAGLMTIVLRNPKYVRKITDALNYVL